MTAEYQVHGSVAVITLSNPPVNGLGLATRTAAVAGIRQALHDEAVKAIVITGAGKAFSGGADIKEFNSPKVRPSRWWRPSTACAWAAAWNWRWAAITAWPRQVRKWPCRK